MKLKTINKDNPPSKELQGRKLYHYTSFENFVKIWLSEHLLLGSVENVNDFLEFKHTIEVNNPCCLPLTEAFDEVRKSFRQTSFTLDNEMEGFKNPMMWGLYANKAKGVCIEFDFDSLFPHYKDEESVYDGFVRYQPIIPKLPRISNQKTINDIREYILSNKDAIMFTKLTAWKAENEYRIISDKMEKINIRGAISAVYLTSCISDECLFVEKLLKCSNVPIWVLSVTTDMSFSQIEVVNPQERREEIEEAKQLNSQAKEYYQSHKSDNDASIIMDCIKL